MQVYTLHAASRASYSSKYVQMLEDIYTNKHAYLYTNNLHAAGRAPAKQGLADV